MDNPYGGEISYVSILSKWPALESNYSLFTHSEAVAQLGTGAPDTRPPVFDV